MKKFLSLLFACLLPLSLVACSNNSASSSNPVTPSAPTSPSASVPISVLDANLSDIRYRSDPFSITIGKLVNAVMEDYEIEYLTCQDALSKGYLTEDQIDDEINRDKFYFAIISGETMVNPDIPYMTEYEKEAVIAWMIFDDTNKLVNSGVDLCTNLETCAIILMTSSF